MRGSVQFGVENVEGTVVITGLSDTPVEIKPGERVLVTQESSLSSSEVQPGVLDVSCLGGD